MQSSTCSSRNAVRAVDDQYEQVIYTLSVYCTQTLSEGDQWWQFTFEFDVFIKKVEIFPRLDYCQHKINNALVEVYDIHQHVAQRCGQVDASSDTIRLVTCGRCLRGRTVRISKANEMLCICEVDFYGMKV